MIVALVPAFNEASRIGKLISHARDFVDMVVVCDDGSLDATAVTSLALGAEVIRHQVNLGYGAALRTLFLKAQTLDADVFVTIDSDGQHDPASIPALVEPIINGWADVVIGSRFLMGSNKSTPAHRRLAIKLITRVVGFVVGQTFTDLQSGLRAYSRSALGLVTPSRRGMGASIEIILRAAALRLRIDEIPVSITYNDKRNPWVQTFRQFLDLFYSVIRFNQKKLLNT